LLQGAVFADETARNGRAYVVIESIEPGSVMDSYGFQAGDIVLSVNQQYVESVDALEIAAAQSPASLLLLVQRGQATQYFRLQ
jgi:S1-C subfamily serine protease